MYYGRVNAKNPSPHRFLAPRRQNNDSEVMKSSFRVYVAGLYGTQWFGRSSRLRIDGMVFRKQLQNQCRSARIALETPWIERARNFTSEIYCQKKFNSAKKCGRKKSRIFSDYVFSSENLKFQIYQKIAEILDFGFFEISKISKNSGENGAWPKSVWRKSVVPKS